MRKVSNNGLKDHFNRTLQIDYMWLDGNPVLHLMEHPHRFSIGVPVESTSVDVAIDVIEARWFTEFWVPQIVKFDIQFDTDAFNNFLQENDITPHKIPARRHNKLSMESKHRVLRDIYIRLKHAAPDESFNRRVARTFRISNDLYGNGVMSAYESAKGFTSPIIPSSTTKKSPRRYQDCPKRVNCKTKTKPDAALKDNPRSEPICR